MIDKDADQLVTDAAGDELGDEERLTKSSDLPQTYDRVGKLQERLMLAWSPLMSNPESAQAVYPTQGLRARPESPLITYSSVC